MNAMKQTAFAILTAVAALAQNSPAPTPAPMAEFEVASIRASGQKLEEGATAGVRIDGAQVRCVALTLKDYIGMAYRIKLYQISGPDWIASDRFDISATIPAGTPTTQFPEMMQRLLEDRFQIKIHHEKKDFPVYVLEVAKGGIKLPESAPDPNAEDAKAPLTIAGSGSAQGIAVNLGRGASYSFANNKFEAKRVSLATLSAVLERFLDRPIVDMTDLKGTYDFALPVTDEDYRVMLIRAGVNAGVAIPPQALRLLDGASTPSLYDAVQKIGLKLDARKAPLDFVVVDDMRKTPTDN